MISLCYCGRVFIHFFDGLCRIGWLEKRRRYFMLTEAGQPVMGQLMKERS